jgi:hypothetical protein
VFEGDMVMWQEEGHDDDRVAIENTRFTGDVSTQFGTLLFKNNQMVGGTLTLTDINPLAEIVGSVFTDSPCAISSVVPVIVRNNNFWNTTSMCSGPDVVGSSGNFAGDPEWVDPANGDFTPAPGSPLIDAGPLDAWATDIDGSRNDVGITGGKYSVLGGW